MDAIYAFKGTEYARLSSNGDTLDDGYPKNTCENWDVPHDWCAEGTKTIDSALYLEEDLN